MPIQDRLLDLIPVGEANAVAARLLWQQIGMWAAASVKHELHRLAAQGIIQSKIVHRNGNEVRLYFLVPHQCVVKQKPPLG
jgi:hypothetical protein